MIKYENIRLKQLIYFCTLLSRSRLNNLDYFKRRFLEQSEHFSETLEFFQYYKLVTVRNKGIHFTSKMQRNIDNLDAAGTEQGLKRFFIALILTEETTLKREIENFLDKFQFTGEFYEFKPTGREKVEKAFLRNFLIDFGVIDLYRDQMKYFIPKSIVFYLKVERKNAVLDEDQFNVLLLARSQLGKKAEIEVIRYERNRLKDWGKHLDIIEHTALINVGAGYDVKSFDVQGIRVVPRYIEVKAISMLDQRFFWSSNEIKCAERNRGKYYLYLVPVGKNLDVSGEEIEIIHDPYKNVLNNNKEWDRNIESISFKKRWTNL